MGENKCPILNADKTIDDGVYVFPLKDNVSQPCQFDVSILKNNTTDFDLCFVLFADTSQVYMDQNYQDKRCYTIHLLQNVSGQSSCIGKACHNNGSCDGSSSVPRCFCRSGFSSNNCTKDFGLAQAIGNNTALQPGPLFGDFVLPELIRCPVLEDCVIPYSVTNSNSSCGYHLSWTGANFSSVSLANSRRPGSLDCSGTATIVHNVTGTDEFCLSLTSDDGLILHDKVCCNVFSEPETSEVNPYIYQSHFISPSPTNGSEFSCTPGQPCHVILSTSIQYNQKCPKVRDMSSSPVHIFDLLSDTVCQHDILILSEKNTTGSNEYCFQTALLSIPGDTRCITVNFKPHAQKEATPTTTSSSIGSTGRTSHSGLMCPKCDADLNCVWNGTCYPDQVCMIRSFHGTTVIHCSEKENCNFIKAAVPHVEILCCEDNQCITHIIP